MKTVFIVDDNDTNRVTAKNALDGEYKTFALPSAARMFKLMEKIIPDLILLDVDMPEMDGFEAMALLMADPKFKTIPVIFLTAKQDSESEIRGFEMGAQDFISKPFSPPVLIKRIESQIETDKLIKRSLQAVRDIHEATISVLANLVESRDQTTGGHIERTQTYLAILVKELVRSGIYAEEVSGWNMDILLPSAQLHDIGKVSISDAVLNKPGKLTDEEFIAIKQHCSHGEKVIDRIIDRSKTDEFLHHAKKFSAYHHEKWDGSGYPRGLSGEDIPLEGRLMAVADVYDALVSERPYKKAFTHEQAVDIIVESSGSHFDPQIVEAFKNITDDFWAESAVFAT